MDFIFLGAGSTNGYDALGHFLRAELVANACLTYALTPVSGCSAKLFNTNGLSSTESGSGESGAGTSKASASKAGTTSLVMERTLAVIKGATPAQAIAKYPGSISAAEATAGAGGTGATAEGATSAQPVGGSSSGTTYYTPSPESSGTSGMLLNYLLGN